MPDRQETDLDTVPQETLTLWENTAHGVGTRRAEAADDTQQAGQFWWYVMLAVLALAVAESLLGNQHLSVDKEAA